MAGYFKGCKTLADEIAEGTAYGYTPFSMNGYVTNINGSYVDLWPLGGLIAFPPSPMQMRVHSYSNIDDNTPPLAGARSVVLNYLDNNYVDHSETIYMDDGSGALTVANNIYRVNSVHVQTAGSNNANADIIWVRDTVGPNGTNTYEQIQLGYNISASCRYTVPFGKTLYITGMQANSTSASGGKIVRMFLKSTSIGEQTYNGIFFNKTIFALKDNLITLNFQVPIKIPATADIIVRAVSDIGAAAEAYVNVWGYLKNA
jgi:hypothetical protein